MDTKALEKFAQAARRQLTDQVTARLQLVLHGDSADLRARAESVAKLRAEIKTTSREAVIERVAYTWFNRFCALRFMDANRYTPLGIVSPALGNTQPEILQEAKVGQIDSIFPVDAARVLDLLGERIPSPDPQQEAYRLLVVAACNYYHGIMPFIFEPIADYTELLMPDDLLSANSVLYALRDAMTEDACRDVEVIGWLYQFYISEKKDAVFAALKQGKKIASEDIPAATQLFTPHWIVRFVVENSLGRLWLLNKPTSKLADHMPYYIRSENQETDFVRVETPEELRICDPAVGSGHMLTYAFDLLYTIYEEEGYNPPDIPKLILHKNLYGIEIDERAGALAAFALTMKARSWDSRFFRRHVHPNVCILRPVIFGVGELAEASWVRDMTTNLLDLPLRDALLHDVQAFSLIDTVGSLLRPQLTTSHINVIRELIHASNNLFSQDLGERVLSVLAQLEYLADTYHTVVANPPYMGSKGMNDELKEFLELHFSNVKSDLFAAFIVRNTELVLKGGQLGFMTPMVWMFISSYEELRLFLIDRKTITSLVQLEYGGFDGAVVPICTFTLENVHSSEYRGGYVRLSDFRGVDNQAPKTLEAIANPNCGWFYRASAADFKNIPGSPIAYWVSENTIDTFSNPSVETLFTAKKGMAIGDNAEFLRLWQEIAIGKMQSANILETQPGTAKWYPCLHGGRFRKWYGNVSHVVNWQNDGEAPKQNIVARTGDHWSRYIISTDYFFRRGATWTAISSGSYGARYFDEGYAFTSASMCAFEKMTEAPIELFLGLVNSKVAQDILYILSPTLNYGIGEIKRIPVIANDLTRSTCKTSLAIIALSRTDWNAYETAWAFTDLPLLRSSRKDTLLSDAYADLRNHWRTTTHEMQLLEEENNRIFIEAYGLQEELTPGIPVEEITLTCNPYYRYGGSRSDEELDRLMGADTMRELISYAVGCMFGRYSLDKRGLILANQGETLTDYLRQVPNPTFTPDKDNVIPILAGDWFPDDAAERFKRFLRVTFGDEHFAENLAFVENAIGRDIRSYFLRDFYDHHLKMYQKRPIYWLFSSPKGSFNALIYMHRYRPDTVSVVLNDYLREFVAKLSARRAHLEQLRISATTPAADKTRALKEIDGIDKTLAELTAYENDILYPLAAQQVKIDLDDGVKVNYAKFGRALRQVPGLSE